MENIVIIGNGISGITCARHIRKHSRHRITVISSETKYFYSRTALMYIYMGHMTYEHTKPYEDDFWEDNRITLVQAHVRDVDTDARLLETEEGDHISFDKLVIATGSAPRLGGWRGEGLKGVQGLYGMPDLEKMEKYTKGIERAVIVGGGLIGVEMAEMLLTRNIGVTMLVREKAYWAGVLPPEEAEMVSRHLVKHHVDLRLETELGEILADAEERVEAVVTTAGDKIPCRFAGLTIGVQPNIRFLQNSGIETDRGVLVNEYFETNIPGIYSIGDCVQYRTPPDGRKAVEQIWYTGRMHGETLAMTLSGSKTAYRPGIFFNSAKFFAIEYQVYGDPKASLAAGHKSVYWEHAGGEKSIRITYHPETGQVSSFNLMGIRYRHAVCDRWIRTGTPVYTVLKHLEEANFDPEFHGNYEQEVRKVYNKAPYKGEVVPVKRKSKNLVARLFG
ncbi:NAD(P)/FAD-dependent oxidoreductase [Roseivirga sp. BDSF3-8]|uniref:NAD(P)/FAD-dependent oxidoreductase n=1 Tax=Roseivirga sp. BDSF3-8 TaxID=3241598 RepID=UPI003531F192